MVAERSSLSSRCHARIVHSQTASSALARSRPSGGAAEAPAPSSIQPMLRRLAEPSSSAAAGSVGRARSRAATPARWLCSTSMRRIRISNSRSRTGPSAGAPVSAAWSARLPKRSSSAQRPGKRARVRATSSPALRAASTKLSRCQPYAPMRAKAAAIRARSKLVSSMHR